MTHGKPIHTAQQRAVRRLDGEPAGVITDQPINGEPPLQAVHRPVAEEPERVVLLGANTKGHQIIRLDRSQLSANTAGPTPPTWDVTSTASPHYRDADDRPPT